MSDASELYPSNSDEDTGASKPAETGSPEGSSSKWLWQVETTSFPLVTEPEGSSSKWPWQVETTPFPSVAGPEGSSDDWVWEVEMTPFPSIAEPAFPFDQPDKGKILPDTAVSQETTLKLVAQKEALTAKQTYLPPWLLALVTAFFAVFLVFWDLPERTLNIGNRPGNLGVQVAIGAVLTAILAGIVYLARLQRWSMLHIKKWAVVLVMCILLIAGVLIPQGIITLSLDAQSLVASANGENFSVYKQSNVPPYFSLAYPSDWYSTAKVNNKGLTAILFITNNGNTPGYFIVLRHLLDPAHNVSYQDDLKSYLAPLCNACSFIPQQTTTQGPWQLIRYQEGNQAGIAWIRDMNGQRVIMTGLADPADMAQDEPIFTAMANSWSPDLNATVPSTGTPASQERQIISDRVLPWISGLLPFLFGLLALPVLWWLRKRPGTIAAGALFFVVLGILQFAYYLQAFIAPRIPQVQLDFSVSSVLLTIAVGTLLVLCWLLIKRQITRQNSRLLIFLLSLNADLAFIVVFLYIFLQASLPPGIAPPVAQVFVAAKLWLQVGLLHIGVPLIITAFMLQVTGWWGARKQEQAVWTYGKAAGMVEEGYRRGYTSYL